GNDLRHDCIMLNAPGDRVRKAQALKGRNDLDGAELISPLQGLGHFGFAHPGRCPGLFHPAPSGLRTMGVTVRSAPGATTRPGRSRPGRERFPFAARGPPQPPWTTSPKLKLMPTSP